MGKFIDLTGKEFGRLKVIERVKNNKWGSPQWLCKCDCGNITIVARGSLTRGLTKSCGCLRSEKAAAAHLVHGHASKKTGTSKTFMIWATMFQRCNNPKATGYKYWGGRGITICDRWSKFKNFLDDMGEKPNGLTLDRKDNDGNYEPSNCRWATPAQQAHNRRPKGSYDKI